MTTVMLYIIIQLGPEHQMGRLHTERYETVQACEVAARQMRPAVVGHRCIGGYEV